MSFNINFSNSSTYALSVYIIFVIIYPRIVQRLDNYNEKAYLKNFKLFNVCRFLILFKCLQIQNFTSKKFYKTN